MKFWNRLTEPANMVSARCPLCGTIVPLVYIFIQKPRWFGRSINVSIEGDGTDWITHLWSHNGR